MTAVEVDDLFKSYGSVNAVRGISFSVQAGEVFGLLGPNGAGKTTTLEILEGHRRRSGGTVAVLGFDPQLGGRAFRERVGIVLQAAGVDAELTVRELLMLHGSWYPRELPIADVIELVGLEQKRSARVGTLSGGQRRRLDLALALVGDPDLIFLDEPTTGFDPAARRNAWELVDRLRRLGRTIILTSHYMDEVQHLADRVIVLSAGRIVAEGPPDSLGADGAPATIVRFRLDERHSSAQLPAELLRTIEIGERELVIRTSAPQRTLTILCDWATATGAELRALEVVRPSLEDIYLELTSGPSAVGHGGAGVGS
jgi:ABC-2 type transport system ATP-binding protein